ncbi:MAG: hypothetical protein ACJAUV_001161 [Flavobacteriales bacterium]|jgi:hypothetical protein
MPRVEQLFDTLGQAGDIIDEIGNVGLAFERHFVSLC